MISQAQASRFTPNDLLEAMRARPRQVVRRQGKHGPIYSLSDALVVLPRPVVERGIAKGVLIANDGNTFALAQKWGGVA